MKAAEVVARALDACNKGCTYQRGKGGMHPLDPLPFRVPEGCDCSGAFAWFLGISRHVVRGHPLHGLFKFQWIETTKVYQDAFQGTNGGFLKMPWTMSLPGDGVVFPDDHSAKKDGHIGLVVETVDGSPSMIVHCSKGNERTHGDAIARTSVDRYWLRRGAIVVRCAAVGYP